ncbi:MAG: hypothetical protein MUE82_11120 [Chloroflexi bacterium]|nr:hypothetical protein [Chloroflexota bacterium]
MYAYQMVRVEPPQGFGSPKFVCMVARLMSTESLNGSDGTVVAASKSSFAGRTAAPNRKSIVADPHPPDAFDTWT